MLDKDRANTAKDCSSTVQRLYVCPEGVLHTLLHTLVDIPSQFSFPVYCIYVDFSVISA